MWASTSLRVALAGMLVVSAVLFAVGSTVERHQRGKETPAATHQEGSDESTGESGGGTATETHRETGVNIVGINTESVGLEVVAIVLSLVLAAAVWLLRRRLAWLWLAVIAFGFVFVAGDARELAHQIDESHAGIAAIAAVLIVLHLAIAGTAAILLRRGTDGAVAVPRTAS